MLYVQIHPQVRRRKVLLKMSITLTCLVILANGFSVKNVFVARHSDGVYSLKGGTQFAILRPDGAGKVVFLDEEGNRVDEQLVAEDETPIGLSREENLVLSWPSLSTKPNVNEEDPRLREIYAITPHWLVRWQGRYFAQGKGVVREFQAHYGPWVGSSICDATGQMAFCASIDKGTIYFVDLQTGKAHSLKPNIRPGWRYCRPELHFQGSHSLVYFADSADISPDLLTSMPLLRERPLSTYEDYFDRVVVSMDLPTGKCTCLFRVQSCGIEPKAAIAHDLSPKFPGPDIAVGKSSLAIRARTRVWFVSKR